MSGNEAFKDKQQETYANTIYKLLGINERDYGGREGVTWNRYRHNAFMKPWLC